MVKKNPKLNINKYLIPLVLFCTLGFNGEL